MFCRSSFVLLAILLSVLLRYMDSDYPFGIFKHFLFRPTWMQWLYKVRLMRNDMNSCSSESSFNGSSDWIETLVLCLGFVVIACVFVQVFFLFCFVFCFYLILFGGCCAAWPVCVVFLLTFWFSYSFLSLSSYIFLYAILPQHYMILRCNAFE